MLCLVQRFKKLVPINSITWPTFDFPESNVLRSVRYASTTDDVDKRIEFE
jgi:hypothetical protein